MSTVLIDNITGVTLVTRVTCRKKTGVTRSVTGLFSNIIVSYKACHTCHSELLTFYFFKDLSKDIEKEYI
jgi:hypothetical protein